MEFKEIMNGDRSIRKFLQRELNREDFEYIFSNVRLAHCGNNRQTLTYYAVLDQKTRDKIAAEVHYAALLDPSIGQPKKDEEAMGYIVIVKPDDQSPIHDIDIGIAAEVITASAYETGIASCMMLNFSKPEMNKILEIPDGRTAAMVIAMGYPAIHSEVVAVNEGNVKYSVDQDCNYFVPKRDVTDLVIWK